MTQETAKELLRKTKVIRDNFYPEPIEPEHEDEQKITFEFLSEVINYLENDTDKLSVEKLQEQNKTMKLALVELSDENIYDNTGFFANEYAKNLVEQIDAGEIETIVERCIRNHQEQLNTAKKYIEHAIGTIKHDGHLGTIQTDWILPDLEKALAVIGGDDDENRL